MREEVRAQSRASVMRRAVVASVTAMTLLIGPVVAAPAAVAEVGDATMTLEKYTEGRPETPPTYRPGDAFTYDLVTSCSALDVAGCTDAVVTDTVPAPLVLDTSQGSPVRAVTGVGNEYVATVSGNTISVAFTQQLDGADRGLLNGSANITVQVAVRVPADVSATSGGLITNTGIATATNAVAVEGSAQIDLDVPVRLAGATTKAVQTGLPGGQPVPAVPGLPVGFTFTGANASNTPIDALVLQDPSAAGSDSFAYLALTGITAFTPPAGADRVEVAWRGSDGVWTSVPGGPRAPPADPDDLLDGVPLADVHGLRFTFTSTQGTIPITAAGGSGSVTLATETRPNVLSIPDGTTITVTNTSQTVATLGAASSAPATAQASFGIRRALPAVALTKTVDDPTLRGGERTAVTLQSTSGVAPTVRMLVADPAASALTFSDQGLTFVGFVADEIEWPVGATAAQVTYVFSDGSTQTLQATRIDTLPDPTDAGVVDRFSVEFTGPMPSAAYAIVPFVVEAQPVPSTVDVTTLNVASAQVFDSLDVASALTVAEASITRQPERVTAAVSKSIVRDWMWSISGLTSLVQMPASVARTGPSPSTIGATSLIVADPGAPTGTTSPFWDAFDLQQIVSTAVPAGSQLTVQYWDGADWSNLPGGAGADIPGPNPGFSYTPDAALREQIQGIRFVFAPLAPATELPPGFNVLPYFRVALRENLRSDPQTPVAGTEATILNEASATAENPQATPDSSTATDTDEIELRSTGGGGGSGPGDLVSKGWLVGGRPSDVATTSALTDQQTSLRITWGTNDYPFATMELSDPVVDPATADIASSVYDAFDLVRIAPITAATDPLMTFDAVSAVELYSASTDEWVDITGTVCTTFTACDGRFLGYTLSAAQRADTIAVRLTIIESPTRAQRIDSPNDPIVGSGVAGSGVSRPLDLTFQLRQDLRSDPQQAVLGTTHAYTYNTGLAGVVSNTVTAVASGADGTFSSSDASDITILDTPINVSFAKTFDQAALGIPPEGTDSTLYPLITATLTARNTSVSKVRELSVADPSPAQGGATVYDTLNLYQIRSITLPAGATRTEVLVTRPGGTTTYGMTTALGLTPTDLADVTAITVRHTGLIVSDASTVIVLDYQERPSTRSADAPIADGRQDDNVARAAVISPGGTPADEPTVDATAQVSFVAPTYEITADKIFNRTTVYEDQSTAYEVTLRSRPSGTARTTTLTLTDDTPTFWNAFTYTGMPAITLPEPVRQVRVDALVGVAYGLDADGELVQTCNGSTDLSTCWTQGVFRASSASGAITPVLPAGVTATQVRGLRFLFRTATGGNWERPFNPQVEVKVTAARNATLRYGVNGATDQPVPSTQPGLVPAPGEPMKGTMTDTLTADGVSSWRNGVNLWTAGASDTATTTLLHRLTSLTINKSPSGPRSPEVDIPFTMTVTNTGTRAITALRLTDQTSVDADGSLLRLADRDPGDTTPHFTFTLVGVNGQTKSTTGWAASFTIATGVIAITPPAGFVFAVGDRLTVTAAMQFRTGLPPETTVENSITATAERLFDSCTGSLNETPTPAASAVASCTGSTSVSPIPAAPLRIQKAVKGDGAGLPDANPGDAHYDDLGVLAYNVATGQCAVPNAGDGFWRSPCVPITRPGGSETWKIEFTNRGNIPANVVSTIDVLPAFGDRGVIIDQARSSMWAPTFQGDITTFGSPGTGARSEVLYLTTVPRTACNAADIKRDTGGLAPTDACYAEVVARNWQPVTPDMTPAQLAQVKALKYRVTYDDPATQGLRPGATVGYTYSTRTAWSAARAEIRDRDSIAWNSTAAGARGVLNSINYSTTVVEPRKVGVAMATGKIDLSKAVESPDDWTVSLPAGYTLDVSCMSGGQPITLVNATGQSMTRVTVAADGSVLHYNNGANPVDTAWSNVNLPLFAECRVSEVGAPAGVVVDYSAQPITALRDWSTRTDVVDPAWPDPVPLQQITVENTFLEAGFRVSKAIDNGTAVDQDDLPISYDELFSFTASCTYLSQQVLTATQRSFTLRGGQSRDVTGLPAGSTCTVTETGKGVADHVTTQLTVAGVAGAVQQQASTTFTLLADGQDEQPQISAAFTNVYTAGSMLITKTLAGAGAAAWGDQDFTVRLVCTLAAADPDIVFDATHVLTRDAPTWRVDDLASAATCRVTETATGGATSTTITPGTITVGRTPATPTPVTVTNTFAVGSMTVRKALDGAPAATLAPATSDSYAVSASCTRTVDGTQIPVAIPGGATRTITGAGTATYAGLPTGAQCSVTETDGGHAASSSVFPAQVMIGDGIAATVTVTNTFPNGVLDLTKRVSGPGADDAPSTFAATVACDWHGAAVPLASSGRVTLVPGQTTRVSGIPVDATCTVMEDDAGQDRTVYTPASATIVASPAVATIDVENVYLRATLRVQKSVDPNEGSVPNAFEFSATCTYLGTTILPLTRFTLDGGEARDFTELPSRSSCTVTETDARGATATVTSVRVEDARRPAVIDQQTRSVTIPELSADVVDGQPRNTVTYTNLFDVAALVVTKQQRGSAADLVALSASYTVDVRCTSQGQVVLETPVVLDAENGYQAEFFDIDGGAVCTVAEPDNQNADATVILPNAGDPRSGVITMPELGVAAVTIQNWYLGGSLSVTKALEGAGADRFGTAEFELALACTLRGTTIDLHGGPTRTFSAQDPEAVYEHLPSGAECALTETDTGGATRSRIVDAGGGDVPVNGDGAYVFTVDVDETDLTDDDQPLPALGVVNEFLLTALEVTKTARTVGGADASSFGPFEVELSCTLAGRPVSADQPSTRPISGGETLSWTGLPVDAECAVTETDARGALATTVTVEGVTADGVNGELTLAEREDDDPYTVAFVNTFPDPMPPTGGEPPWAAIWLALGLLMAGALACVIASTGPRARRAEWL